MRLNRKSGFALPLVVAGLLGVAACSSGAGTGTPTGAATQGAGVVASASASTAASSAAPASSAAAADSGALSGTWSGQYGGSYQGTFTLDWQQSGSSLSGQITLSAPAQTLPINGTVNGGSIQFGTVGSTAITYSGSVSGTSMSGTYKVGADADAQGGNWSASKS